MHRDIPLSSSEVSKESSTRALPVTPLKSLANLAVPDLISLARRSSPRAEDTSKNDSHRRLETTRKRLVVHQSVDDAVELLKKSDNIVVLSGAGISTSVGIPDFRSDKGLYQKLSRDLGIEEPEDFFSNSYFQEKPAEFFSYVKAVLPKAVACPGGTYKAVDGQKASAINTIAQVPKYSSTHAFLAVLQLKEKLLTNYTQNIDGLESAAGLHPTKFIQCHGSWDTALCLTCAKVVAARKYLPIVFQGNVPYCKCSAQLPDDSISKSQRRKKQRSVKAAKKRKRATSEDWGSDHSSDAYDNLTAPRGLLKPNITFFEDPITADYKDRLQHDKTKVDLLIVIGTSLKVAPIQQMLYQIPPHVPQIYISKTRFSGSLCSLPGVQVDIELLGEADIIIEELCRRAGWMKSLRRCLWEDKQMKIKTPRLDAQLTHKSESVNDYNDYGILTKRTKTETSTEDKKVKYIRSENVTVDSAQHPVSGFEEETPHESSSQSPFTTIVHPKSTNGSIQKVAHASPDTEVSIPNDKIITTTTTITTTQAKQPLDPISPDLNIRVELVEGTAHQWRFTRIAP